MAIDTLSNSDSTHEQYREQYEQYKGFWIEKLQDPERFRETGRLQELTALLNQLHRDGSRELNENHVWSAIKYGHVLVAWEGIKGHTLIPKLVGTMTLTVSHNLTGKYGILEDVIVHEHFRRHGIAKAMLHHMIARAKRMDVEVIELTSHSSRIAAHALYRSFGFTTRETTVFELEF